MLVQISQSSRSSALPSKTQLMVLISENPSSAEGASNCFLNDQKAVVGSNSLRFYQDVCWSVLFFGWHSLFFKRTSPGASGAKYVRYTLLCIASSIGAENVKHLGRKGQWGKIRSYARRLTWSGCWTLLQCWHILHASLYPYSCYLQYVIESGV